MIQQAGGKLSQRGTICVHVSRTHWAWNIVEVPPRPDGTREGHCEGGGDKAKRRDAQLAASLHEFTHECGGG